MEIPAYYFVYLAAILSLLQQTLADSPPIFRKEPSTEAVKQNSRVRIKCKVEPKDADVSWLFNGQDVVESEGVSVHRGNLIIEVFTDELHRGYYQCVASNNAGSVISAEAYLQVAYIVNFPKTLPDRTYSLPGDVAVIDCQRPESIPPAQMQYFFNGTLIVENDHYRIVPSGRLHILHTTSDDEGLYGCRAINPVTSRSREQINATTLEIAGETSARQDKPVSIPFASGASSHVGDQAVLECVADGHPSPSVRWQRRGDQGVLLPERAVQHLGSLKIPDVSVDDAGVYECVVENRLGTPVMQEVVLEVIELPAITKPPKSISVGVGGNAQFKCGVTGAAEQNITWLHNALPVPQDNPQYMVQVGTGGVQLLVMDITRAQLGVYQCIVRTSQGMAHAAAILKFREGFPSITRPPVNTTAIEGENVFMSCSGSGLPQPDVSWFMPNGRPVVNDRRTILSKPSGGMTLRDVGPGDAGWYRCTASNTLGAVSSSVYLAVIEKLDATTTPPSRKTIGKPLSSDDGNMTVENTEEPGKPGSVPNAPGKPDIFKTSDISVEVRWTYTFDSSSTTPLVRYTIEYMNIRGSLEWQVATNSVDPTSLSYEVNNLVAGGIYRFRVYAGNRYGDSISSQLSNRFYLQASTPTERPVRAPMGEVRITSSKAVSSSAIMVVWEYTPDERINTPIDGFYIYHRDTDSDDDRDYIRTPVVGSGATRYLIDKLEREVSYDIKMTSFNSAGTSGFSNVVIVATPAPETPITFIPGPAIPSPDTIPNDLGGQLPDGTDNAEPNGSGTNQDILYITLGVVLGAMLLVLIMFGVMCIWRAKQVNHERDWRRGPAPYYDGSSYRYINSNGSGPHYKFHPINGNGMNGGPHQPPNHLYTQGIGHLPFGETATAIDPQPLYPLSQNGMVDEHSIMLTSNPSISNGHGPSYMSNGHINRPYVPNGQQKTVPMLPRTSSEPARSGFSPARSREGPLHSGSSSEHLQNGCNGSLRSYNSNNSGPDAGTMSSRESGRSRSRRPKCPHRHPHKTDVNKAVRRQPNEHPTSREGSIGSSLDCASVEASPPPTPTSSTAPSIHSTTAPSIHSTTAPPGPGSDGGGMESRSRSSSNLSNASSSRNVKHSDIF